MASPTLPEQYTIQHARTTRRSYSVRLYCAGRDLQEAGVTEPELDALAAEITPFFAPGNGLVQSLTQYTEDPQALEKVRTKLGEYIEMAERLRK